MTEYQTHEAVTRQLYEEVSRLKAINAELAASIQKPVQADTSQIMSNGIKPNNSLVQAARQALEVLSELAEWESEGDPRHPASAAITALREALEAQEPWTPDDMAYRPGGLSQHVTDDHQVFKLGYAKGVDDAERRAKARGEQPAAPTQDPAAWAITYDGRTPHTLWHEGDGPLLDLEIKRQGGSAQKMALYTAPQPAAVEQEPVLVVEREPSYMNRGHFYKGDKPHIDPTKVWKLPIGTKLYTAPQPTRQAARQPLDEGKLKAMWVQNAPHIGAPLEFARAIEKAHGIGGEA